MAKDRNKERILGKMINPKSNNQSSMENLTCPMVNNNIHQQPCSACCPYKIIALGFNNTRIITFEILIKKKKIVKKKLKYCPEKNYREKEFDINPRFKYKKRQNC